MSRGNGLSAAEPPPTEATGALVGEEGLLEENRDRWVGMDLAEACRNW
jgi:hypothetical protein